MSSREDLLIEILEKLVARERHTRHVAYIAIGLAVGDLIARVLGL